MTARSAPRGAGSSVKAAAFPLPPEPLDLVGVAARVAVGAVLAYSGLHKAAAPTAEFAAVIEGYYLLPDPYVILAAKVIPWCELLAGLALAAGYLTRAAAVGAGAMLASFIFALSSARFRGIPLENCGCFGEGIHLTAAQATALDLALLALTALAFSRGARAWSLDRWVQEGT